jgi:hypothetical protein
MRRFSGGFFYSLVRRMRFIVIAVCSVVLFFPTYWLFESVVGANWGAGIAAVAMYIAFPVLAMKVWPGKPAKPPLTMEGALDEGALGVADYDISDVVEIEQSEDEGLHFLLEVGEGKTLFLSGQYLYAPVEAGHFPNSRVRVFWHTKHDITFGIQCVGARLFSSRKLSPLTDETVRSYEFPADRDLIGQPLRAVVERLALNGRVDG